MRVGNDLLSGSEPLVASSTGGTSAMSVDLAHLNNLSALFIDIDRMTEESFLRLGSQVNSFRQKAGEISACTVQTMQLLEGETGEQALMRLQLLVERCSLWFDDAQAHTARVVAVLEEIMMQLSSMVTPLRGLRKLVKTLQGVRISTRVESARVPGAGAHVLADELKHLTDLIQDKVQKIEEQFDSLSTLSGRILDHEKQVNQGSMKTAQRGIQESRLTLSLLSGQRLETGQQTGTLQKQSDGIAAHFGEIIVALQFQDITRQRMEHIQSALEDLSAQVSPANRDETGLSSEEALLVTGEVCRLQYEHLEQVLKEFDSAVDTLTQNLEEVVPRVRALTGKSGRLEINPDANPEDEQLFGFALLQTVTNQMEDVLGLHEDANSAIRTVCQKVGEITSQISAVEFVGEEMQLMALNAAINAAHYRGRGAGLQVIAEQIKSLADDAFARTVELVGECCLVTDQTAGLERLDAAGDQLETRLTELMTEGRTLFETLQRNRQELTTQIFEISGEVNQFGEDVAACLATITIRERFRAALVPLLDGLRLMSHCAQSRAEGDSDAKAHLFRKIHSRYTMYSERAIHDSLAVGPKISDQKSGVDRRQTAATETEDLGDNIEFF